MEDSGLEINISEMLKDMVKKDENIFDKQDQKIRVQEVLKWSMNL